MKPTPGVDQLISGTITRIGQHADVDNVLAALVQGKFTAVPRPPGVPLDAVKAFRKRNKKVRRALVAEAFQARRQTTLPGSDSGDAQTVPSTVSPRPTEITRVSSDVLVADIARKTALELKEENGEVFITLRCFEKLIGKTPENLQRTLVARGFPITQVALPNAVGNTRQTPAIHIDYIFAVVSLADLHGMDDSERERLFKIQRELPGWMKTYEATKAYHQALATPKEEHRPLLTKGGVMISVAHLAATVAERVVHVVADFANRLDIRLDRIERLLTTKPAPGIASTNGTPKFPLPPNKFGVVRPFLTAEALFERIDQELCREQRNLGIDSPEAVINLARNLGIYRTQHWGRVVRNDEWEFDAGKEATTSLTWMLDYLHKNIVARNSQPVAPS